MSSEPGESETTPGSTYLYFAYGSNLSTERLRSRAPSGVSLGKARLDGHVLRWHKLGRDGSGKCDIVCTDSDSADVVWGVLYRIDRRDKEALDFAEGLGVGYDERFVEVHARAGPRRALTYKAKPGKIDPSLKPRDWYKAHVLRGAREHGLPTEYVERLARVPVVDQFG